MLLSLWHHDIGWFLLSVVSYNILLEKIEKNSKNVNLRSQFISQNKRRVAFVVLSQHVVRSLDQEVLLQNNNTDTEGLVVPQLYHA